ncbi:MAG TPA: glycosyltransferase family A protein [Patescibacteria group bacterium]|nr:glycosyltransferase family A protein [Patescibacteria group bacterium]
MNTQNITQPFISIVLPVFNDAYYLPSCLDSILAQSYDNFEVIAIDDFSRDDSWKVLRIYRSSDERIKIYRNVKHYGKVLTINRILRKAKGQYLVFMDPKDRMYKEKVKKQLHYLQRHEKIVGVGTQCSLVNEQTKRVGTTGYPHHILSSFEALRMEPGTIMINKLLLPKDLLYFSGDEDFMYTTMVMKLFSFGILANLLQPLQYHYIETSAVMSPISRVASTIRLTMLSFFEHNHLPSPRYVYSLFSRATMLS